VKRGSHELACNQGVVGRTDSSQTRTHEVADDEAEPIQSPPGHYSRILGHGAARRIGAAAHAAEGSVRRRERVASEAALCG
jgi:hypothetical protein